MDHAWEVSWPAGSVIIHASTQAEVYRKMGEYFAAKPPFVIAPVKGEYDTQADGEACHTSAKRGS